MRQGQAETEESRQAATASLPHSDRLPLSIAQLPIWLDSHLSETRAWANCGDTLEVRGPLDVPLFDRALRHTVANTAALRLQLVEREGLPQQTIQPQVEFDVPLVDLGDHPSEATLSAWLREEHRRPLDPCGPLFRFAVIRLAPEHALVSCVAHHCCVDGYGLSLLWSRIAEAYAAMSRGLLPARESDVEQYGKYIQSELARAEAALGTEGKEKAAVGAVADDFTFSRLPRANAPRSGPLRARVCLPQELSEELRECAAGLGISVSQLIRAALVLYAGRFSGKESFLLLMPIHGRFSKRSRDLIAMCTSTLPVRFTVDETASVASLVRTVNVQVDEALADSLRRGDLGLNRHQSGARIAISINVVTFAALSSMGQLSVCAGYYESLGPINDLEILVDLRDPSRPRLELWANARQYEQGEIDAHLPRMVHWLREIAQNPETPLLGLRLCDEDERRRVVGGWNDTACALQVPAGLHQLFEAQARKTPGAIASVYEDVELTYAELDRRADALARRLRLRGVRTESVVALVVHRSNEMLVGALGILKAGGAYLPIEPQTPRERIELMLKDADAGVVLTQSKWRESLSGLGVDVVYLDAEAQRHEEDSAALDEVAVHPLQLAYVIYTSGSTGRPKGVMNAHGAVLNRIAWAQANNPLTPADRFLQKTPLTFDVSVWELFWAISYGARLVFARPEGHRDPSYLVATIERFGITLVHFVPSLLKEFVTMLAPGRCATLRATFASGEALPRELATAFRQRSSSLLRNLYGPTEAAIEVSHHLCTGRETGLSIPIGKPIANLTLHVLDERMEPCPVGKLGELYIGGQGVARGYAGRAGLTASCFVADPFGPAGSRLYRTGDQVFRLMDGSLEFLGRLDHQVKIRGLRVELGEIETVLRGHPAVQDAVVIVRKDAASDQMLVAYVVSGDTQPAVAALRAHLRSKLPEYMVPGAFMLLSSFPLTSSGKLDRRALPEPDDGAYRSLPYEPPESLIEREVAEVLAEVLHRERVGRHDNFFESGGSSLTAVRAVDRLRRRGYLVELTWLFRSSTPAQLAGALEENRREQGTGSTPQLDAGVPESQDAPLATPTEAQLARIAQKLSNGKHEIEDAYPLTPLQAGILFHHLLIRKGDPYLQYVWLAFESREAVERFLAAMEQLIQRHDVFRTAMTWDGSLPLQVLLRDVKWTPEELEFPAGDVERALAERFASRHFRLDIREPPLMKGCFAYDGERNRWVFLWILHHLICDWFSAQVLFEELGAILSGMGSELPAPVPFRRHVARVHAASRDSAHQKFFSEMLGTLTRPTVVPGAAEPQAGEGLAVGKASAVLGSDDAQLMSESARRANVSVGCLCHLAFAAVLGRVCEQDDVVFGTVLFGRAHCSEDASRAVGMYINTLPMRIKLDERTVESALRDTQALLGALLLHEHASLDAVQRCSGLPPATPLISALLNYKQSRKNGASGHGLEFLRVDADMTYAIAISIDDDGERLKIEAQSPFIDPGALCESLCRVLREVPAALEDPQSRGLRSLAARANAQEGRRHVTCS